MHSFAAREPQPAAAGKQIVSFGNDSAIVASLDRAMDTVLEAKCDRVRRLVARACASKRPALPAGEATILWLRNNLRNSAEQIIGLAKRHYVESRGA